MSPAARRRPARPRRPLLALLGLLVLLALFAVALFSALSLAERRLVPWARPSDPKDS